MKKNINLLLIILGIAITLVSCKKSSFLDANNDQKQIIPKTISDFQEILNSNEGRVPALTIDGADEYYWLKDQLNIAFYGIYTFNVYTWNDDIWYNYINENWNFPYNEVFKTNIALDGLNKIKPTANQQIEWNEAKGTALFYRSFYFYQLLQLFAPVYDAANASTQLGIPLRLGSDIQEQLRRGTVQECYERVIDDLKVAKGLLPNTPKFKWRPSAHAASAMLARIYLVMGDFNNALKYTNESLSYNNALLDYNFETIERNNKEVIFSVTCNASFPPNYEYASTAVDDGVIDNYMVGDLRKTIFFGDNNSSGKYFKGTYASVNGSTDALFAGLATDEIYLIRAECYARAGNTALALADLNALMTKRWKNDGSWIPYTATSADEALQKILLERRKELVFRGLRWTDLRRLNKLGANITLKRTLDQSELIF